MNLFNLGFPKIPESVLKAGSKAFSVAIPALQVGALALIVVAVAKGILEASRNPHPSLYPVDSDSDDGADSSRYVDRWTSEPIDYPPTPIIVEKEVIVTIEIPAAS